jgi:ankyrin repeat protein
MPDVFRSRLTVELLTEKGAHPDVRDAWMRTPVHFAAAFGWGDRFPCVVTSLYFAGANREQSHVNWFLV